MFRPYRAVLSVSHHKYLSHDDESTLCLLGADGAYSLPFCHQFVCLLVCLSVYCVPLSFVFSDFSSLLGELFVTDFNGLGVYRSERACVNSWGLFHRTSYRVDGCLRLLVVFLVVSCFAFVMGREFVGVFFAHTRGGVFRRWYLSMDYCIADAPFRDESTLFVVVGQDGGRHGCHGKNGPDEA